MVDLAQTVSEWKDVESNKEDDQYLGDICFSLRYVPTSGKVRDIQQLWRPSNACFS
jgi:synaptotagmin-1